jgi:uncharacterized cupredoxin-like copper-binding protein
MKRLVLVIAVLLIAAACGDDDGATTTTPGVSPVARDVVLDDLFFAPGTLTVPAGAQVTLSLANEGGLDHSWVLLSAGPDVTTVDGLDPARVLVSYSLASGASDEVTFVAPSAGLYQVICDVTGHIEAGMEGTLIVE